MFDGGKKVTRRSVLGLLGSTAVAGSVPTVGSAKPEFRKIIDQAHRIREKTGSQQRFLKYLRSHGLTVANQRTEYVVPAQSEGISTAEISENYLDVELTLVYNYYQCSLENIYTEYSWTWDVQSGNGETPKDFISLGWPSDHYDYDSETHGSNVNHYDRDNDLTGSVWKYDDSHLSAGDTDSSYAGCYLKETTTDQDRHVGGKYRHTWNSIELDSITYSSDGVVEVTFENTTDRWKSGFEKIYESEAEHNTTNC